MAAHLSIRDRLRDAVALYDITHQGAKTVLAPLNQRLDASTDETAYWHARIAAPRPDCRSTTPTSPARCRRLRRCSHGRPNHAACETNARSTSGTRTASATGSQPGGVPQQWFQQGCTGRKQTRP